MIKKTFNKYHNIKSEKYGFKWDSQMELCYYEYLIENKDNLGILDIQHQVTYELQEKFKYGNKTILPIRYIADFVITYEDRIEIIDIKGMPPTPDFKIKWKMMKFLHRDKTFKCLKSKGKGINKIWEDVKGV